MNAHRHARADAVRELYGAATMPEDREAIHSIHWHTVNIVESLHSVVTVQFVWPSSDERELRKAAAIVRPTIYRRAI